LVLYWAVAVIGAIMAPMQGWIDLRWPIAIYFFAIPVTLLLCLLYAAGRGFPRLIAGRRFMAIGLVLPVIYVAIASNGGRLLNERATKRLEYQQDAARLETLVDEPLTTDHGVIGIRLRYRVAFPKGLDLDEWHGAFAELGLSTPTRSGFGGFMTLKRRVRPAVGGKYPPGSYEITEDFAPLFLSDVLQKTIGGPAITQIPTPMAAEPAARCLRWSIPYDREALLTAPPQPMQIAIYIARTPMIRATKRSYRVGEFFETALALGALDCPAQ
jgi:hypothetical protein